MRKSLLFITLFIFISISSFSNSNNESSNIQTDKSYQFIDSKGREVYIKKDIQSVVSLAPNLTEIIFSIGAGEKLKGRTEYCNYPEEVSDIEAVGTLFDPDIEKLVEINPDIIIASSHFQQEVLAKLEEIGMNIVIIQEEGSFSGVYKTINDIGFILNRVEQSEELIQSMQKKVKEITDKVKDRDKLSVYYVVAYGEYGDFTAGGDTFISEIINMAGGINSAENLKGWSYSLEKIIENNPDIFICSKYNKTIEGIIKATGYKDIPAIVSGNIFAIDNNLLDRQGPRIVDGLEAIARILHPECF